MIDWLRGHGVDDVVHRPAASWPTACATCSATARHAGVRLRYVEEPEPLGTAGASSSPSRCSTSASSCSTATCSTDLDLTAQLAPARGSRRARDARARPGRGPDRLRPRAPTDDERRASTRVPREARARPRSTRTAINAGAYVLERDVLDLIPRRRARLDRARRLPAAGRRRPLRATTLDGYWLDIGTPERYLQATWDILEGTVAHRRARSAWAPATCPSTGDGSRAAGSSPPALVERRCRVAAGAQRRPARGRARAAASTRRRGHDGRALGRARSGAEIGSGCALRDCIVGRRRAGRGQHRTSTGGAVLGEGVTHRRRQRHDRRRADLPGRPIPDGGSGSDGASAAAVACVRRFRAHRPMTPLEPARRRSRRRPTGQLDDILDLPSTCATRCGGSSPPAVAASDAPAASSSPAWAARRSAARWRARRARRPRLAADPRRRAATSCRRGRRPDTTVLCASYSGDTEETLACYEAAGRARRPARRRHHRRRARRARRAPTACR